MNVVEPSEGQPNFTRIKLLTVTVTLTAAKFNDGFMDFLHLLIHCYGSLRNPFTSKHFGLVFTPFRTANVKQTRKRKRLYVPSTEYMVNVRNHIYTFRLNSFFQFVIHCLCLASTQRSALAMKLCRVIQSSFLSSPFVPYNKRPIKRT